MTEVESHIEIKGIRHSPTGASGASRWMNCPGSINLFMSVLGGVGGGAGKAAAEGTCAHEILANCLLDQRDPWEFIGTFMSVEDFDFEVDDVMTDAVQMAVTHILNLREKHAEAVEKVEFIEVSMSHSEHPDDLFGTTDYALVVVHDDGTVTVYIRDYKHGVGVSVEATSPQLLYYALLVLNNIDPALLPGDWNDITVDLGIIQPRCPHPKGPIRTTRTTGADLLEWYRDELEPALLETKNPDAILQVGDWCKFCPVKGQCPAQKGEVMDLNTEIDPVHLTPDEIGELLAKKSAIIKYLETIEQMAFDLLNKGEPVQGFKLVRKKANRTWKAGAEQMLIEKFGDTAYQEPKLLGPPGIEKLPGGKKFVATYAYTPDTGITIAPASDKRPEVESDIAMLADVVSGS